MVREYFIRKVIQNQGKQPNVRDTEEFESNGSRDIEVQLYIQLCQINLFQL